MKVWIHKETFQLMITWQCYAMWSEYRENISLQCPVYVGEACENGNGVTCIFSTEIYKDFDYVGAL